MTDFRLLPNGDGGVVPRITQPPTALYDTGVRIEGNLLHLQVTGYPAEAAEAVIRFKALMRVLFERELGPPTDGTQPLAPPQDVG